ncbi:hypothetical protein WJX72_012474 [[Myrmecia] bisecta]|uniref:J domain-containing protein n=1 Tax=[Myrmecia] bisecta TaxID=41462 RepID=A0AAW1PHG3_9CHLO
MNENSGPNASTSGRSLYELLDVSKDASQADIKKAYHRLAIKLHPDKNPGDKATSAKFQSLQRIYTVLSDPERRKVYDATGSIEDSEELAGEQFNDLYSYYRSLYKKVTEDDIDRFAAEYRGSEEETRNLLEYYQQFSGDMEQVFAFLICSDPDRDSHRFLDTINAAIEAGTVKQYKRFASWAKAVSGCKRPKNPLAPRKRSVAEAAGQAALVAQIRGRNAAQMDGFMSALESKYVQPSKGRKAKASQAAPTDAEFEAARARMESANTQGKRKRARS